MERNQTELTQKSNENSHSEYQKTDEPYQEPDALFPTLQGVRSLRPDEISFVYGVHRQDERLQFTMKNAVAADEVFGMEPGRDGDVTVFAYYDLKRGAVCDALDVKVFEDDGSKPYYEYRLNSEEKSLIRNKMEVYSMAKSGLNLAEQEARYWAESGIALQSASPRKQSRKRQRER